MTPQVRMKPPLPPASQNHIATLTAKCIARGQISNVFSVDHAALSSTNQMKSIAIILFALLLCTASGCTNVDVSVRQPAASSDLTGTHCKLQRELTNQHQETNVWCWAASTHTVIKYLKNQPIKQCELLHAVYQGYLTHDWSLEPPSSQDPPNCCMKMPEDDLDPREKNVEIAQTHCVIRSA